MLLALTQPPIAFENDCCVSGVTGAAGAAVASLARKNDPLKMMPPSAPRPPGSGGTGSICGQHVPMNSANLTLCALYEVIKSP